MHHLSSKDLGTLLELVRGAYAMRDVAEFRTGILQLVRQAVPCTLVAYNELEPGTDRAIALFEPEETMIFEDPGAVLAEVAPSSPIVNRYLETRDGRVYKLSDFLTLAELHETPLWKQALGPLGVHYQMAFTLPSQPSILIGITLNDAERDFTERDRTLLNLARSELAHAYRNAQIHTEARLRLKGLERGLEASGLSAVLLRRDGRAGAATPKAEAMLEDAFGEGLGRAGALPGPLADWVRARRAAVDGPAVPMVARGRETRVLVRYVPREADGEPDILLLERSGHPVSTESLQMLGLSPRESEVLRLAALGEPGESIAAALGISPSTLKKHLQNIYRKLGVRSRAAAVATAWAGSETRAMLDVD